MTPFCLWVYNHNIYSLPFLLSHLPSTLLDIFQISVLCSTSFYCINICIHICICINKYSLFILYQMYIYILQGDLWNCTTNSCALSWVRSLLPLLAFIGYLLFFCVKWKFHEIFIVWFGKLTVSSLCSSHLGSHVGEILYVWLLISLGDTISQKNSSSSDSYNFSVHLLKQSINNVFYLQISIVFILYHPSINSCQLSPQGNFFLKQRPL